MSSSVHNNHNNHFSLSPRPSPLPRNHVRTPSPRRRTLSPHSHSSRSRSPPRSYSYRRYTPSPGRHTPSPRRYVSSPPPRTSRRRPQRDERRRRDVTRHVSPSRRIPDTRVCDLFLEALKRVMRVKHPPINISVVSDFMSRIEPEWAVWKTNWATFSALCRDMERKGHLKVGRRGESVVVEESVYEGGRRKRDRSSSDWSDDEEAWMQRKRRAREYDHNEEDDRKRMRKKRRSYADGYDGSGRYRDDHRNEYDSDRDYRREESVRHHRRHRHHDRRERERRYREQQEDSYYPRVRSPGHRRRDSLRRHGSRRERYGSDSERYESDRGRYNSEYERCESNGGHYDSDHERRSRGHGQHSRDHGQHNRDHGRHNRSHKRYDLDHERYDRDHERYDRDHERYGRAHERYGRAHERCDHAHERYDRDHKRYDHDHERHDSDHERQDRYHSQYSEKARRRQWRQARDREEVASGQAEKEEERLRRSKEGQDADTEVQASGSSAVRSKEELEKNDIAIGDFEEPNTGESSIKGEGPNTEEIVDAKHEDDTFGDVMNTEQDLGRESNISVENETKKLGEGELLGSREELARNQICSGDVNGDANNVAESSGKDLKMKKSTFEHAESKNGLADGHLKHKKDQPFVQMTEDKTGVSDGNKDREVCPSALVLGKKTVKGHGDGQVLREENQFLQDTNSKAVTGDFN